MSASIPVIDLQAALAGDPAERLRVGRQIDDTCRQIGFFTIKGHGVDLTLIETLRAQSYAFFEQRSRSSSRSRRRT